MKLTYYIITGTSRGLGEAIASKLLSPANFLICISRTENPRLQVECLTKKGNLRDIAFDLADTAKIPALMQDILRFIEPSEVNEICLINNAGTIQPVKAVGHADQPLRVSQNISVNLIAPVLLCECFIAGTEEWQVPRKIVNVSTGAAQRPVSGWSAYCASKAGLEMYSHCIAQEQAGSPNAVPVLSYAPGIIDTAMQAEVREADETDFPELSKFRHYKESGALLDPARVAEDLLARMKAPEFGKEVTARIQV